MDRIIIGLLVLFFISCNEKHLSKQDEILVGKYVDSEYTYINLAYEYAYDTTNFKSDSVRLVLGKKYLSMANHYDSLKQKIYDK